MEKRGYENRLGKVGLTILIWLLAFQRPLEDIWHPFFYLDEITAFLGACLAFNDIVIVHKCRPNANQLMLGIPLFVFTAVGLAGNLIYQYQPIKCVIIDLYTNLKFFCAIGTGSYLFASLDWETAKKTARQNAQLIILILFALFLIDRVFHIWPGQVRYGITSSRLFYVHPSYLAGALAFLLVLLTVFYDKNSLPYIAMALTIMVFTLRAKAFASAAVFVGIFAFLLIFQWRLRFWHVIAVGLGSVIAAWNMIRYYFIELAGRSARSVMLQTAFQIMKDYFPTGTGFGTFGSEQAARHYSPVYLLYNFNDVWELRDVGNVENTLRLIAKYPYLTEQYQIHSEEVLQWSQFHGDQFWPTIMGQSGVIGTVMFLIILAVLFKFCLAVEKYDRCAFAGVLFAFCYLLISSSAESAFHNAIAIPMAIVIGMIFQKIEVAKKNDF